MFLNKEALFACEPSVSGVVSVNEVSRFLRDTYGTRRLFHLFSSCLARINKNIINPALFSVSLLRVPVFSVLSFHCFEKASRFCLCEPSRPTLVVARDQEWQEFTCTHPTSPTPDPPPFPSQFFVLFWEPCSRPYLKPVFISSRSLPFFFFPQDKEGNTVDITLSSFRFSDSCAQGSYFGV